MGRILNVRFDFCVKFGVCYTTHSRLALDKQVQVIAFCFTEKKSCTVGFLILTNGKIKTFKEEVVVNRDYNNIPLIIGAIALVLGMIFLAFEIVTVGVIELICGGILFIYAILSKRSEKKMKPLRYEYNKKNFYKECVQNGIKKLSTEKEIQKAKLIAQKHNIEYTDIVALFSEAENLFDVDTANKKEAEINRKKAEEKNQYAELIEYLSFKGRDKRIAILSAERADALKSAKTLRAGAQAVMSASQQKEHDWAIHGGIASGIAGPAAGLATAADIQAKNAKIRAQNEANAKAFAPIMMASYSGASDYDRRANALQEEIETTKTKLVSDDDAKTCLSKIIFSNTKVETSETGTCTVTTSAMLAERMIIFDDVEAIIDGTIIAKIYDGKTLVGTASLVLPKYGVRGETKLKGMCLYCGTKGKTYTVEYAAVNLWAMER